MSDLPFNKNHTGRTMRRRDFLKIALAGLSVAPAHARGLAAGQRGADSWAKGVCDYLESLRRADGGYAWADQRQSHLTPSFAAVGCYHLLGREPPEKGALVEFLRTHHPFRIKKLERDLRVFEFQQIQSLLWLGQDVSSFREQVKGWTKPSAYPVVYEKHGYPILQLETMSVLCRQLVGLSMEDIAPAFARYFEARQRPNGSFSNTPAADGGDGHAMNTWWATQALEALGKSHEKRQEIIDWVQRCQQPGGGFTWQPEPSFAAVEDVTYTWAAVQILKHLGTSPARRQACIDYLRSLRNADRGFSDRPGWPSNAEATYRALDALQGLDALDSLASSPVTPIRAKEHGQLPDNLRVFTVQIEAHGRGSCIEAVELARALHIDLWGAKNAPAGWIARAQSIADERKVPVTFFVANEEYGTLVDVPGMGTYSHTSDIIAPAGADFGASLAGEKVLSWEEFRRRRLAPLQKADGRLIWQFGENEELTRLYLDDSLQRGGYAAISTFHFGNPDFTNSEPFLKHYWQRIPFIGLQDAHGEESWWWLDQLEGFRTLFLATEPTWKSWLTAVKNNWVVAVRHDRVSSGQTWMHGGSPEVLEFVGRREPQWRWWDNPSIQSPAVSLVAVKPDDKWEAARPDQGVTIRVRCRWDCTTQGLPKTPRVELIGLDVDGQKVTPSLASPKAKAAAYQDYYHFYPMAEVAPGKHTATATVRALATKAESSHTIEFAV